MSTRNSVFDCFENLFVNELYDEFIYCYELKGLSGYRLEAVGIIYSNTGDFRDLNDFCAVVGDLDIIICGVFEQCLKHLVASGGKSLGRKHYGENDIRFRYHKALVQARQYGEAFTVLRGCKGDLPPKYYAALAKLQQRQDKGKLKEQATLYLYEVMNKCDYAFETAITLLRSGHEIEKCGYSRIAAALMCEALSDFGNPLSVLVAVAELQGSGNTLKAISLLKKNCDNYVRLHCELGEMYYQYGLMEESRRVLSVAHRMDRSVTQGMDRLASLYGAYQERAYFFDLDELAADLRRSSGDKAHAWIAFGYLARFEGAPTKGLHFVHRALEMPHTLGSLRSSAIMLKAYILVDMDRNRDAIQLIGNAIKDDPTNIELYEAQLGMYLEANQSREARLLIASCLHNTGSNPRARLLQAKMLHRSMPSIVSTPQPVTRQSALRGTRHAPEMEELLGILEPLVADCPFLLDAMLLLLDQYQKIEQWDKAIELIDHFQSLTISTDRLALLSSRKSEFLERASRLGEAFENASNAVNLEHTTAQAQYSSLDAQLRQHTPPVALREAVIPPAPNPRRINRMTHLRNIEWSPPTEEQPRAFFYYDENEDDDDANREDDSVLDVAMDLGSDTN